MKKLRVLHLSSERTWRGGEQQIAYLLEALDRMPCENWLAVRQGSAMEQHCKEKNYRCIPLSFGSSLNLRTALKIKAICKQHKIDLIHMHTPKAHALGVLSALIGNKTPLILHRRVAFQPKDSFFTRWKYNHPQIKKIVCISNKVKSVMQHYVKNGEKCVVIYSGIDLEKFAYPFNENILRKEYSVPEHTAIIGNIAALDPQKDLLTFIDAIHGLLKKGFDVRAFIVGEGKLRQELTRRIAELNLIDKVILTGFRKDVISVLRSLDVFVFTTKQEGLGTSVLDAFAAGVPVIASNVGGIPEMVVHKETGLLASSGDADSFTENIIALMHDTALKQTIVQQAKEKVKLFSKEQMAARTFDLYQSVLKNDVVK